MSKGTKKAPKNSYFDCFIKVLSHAAQGYLHLEVSRKAIIYIVFVLVLSIISTIFTLPDHYYFVQKHNIFNKYGTKIGWFWTLLFLTPFIWLTSMARNNSKFKACQNLLRLGISTILWYSFTSMFVRFEHITGKCNGENDFSRLQCMRHDKEWIPGIDISGHTFMLVLANLIISEEAFSFKNWPSSSMVHNPGSQSRIGGARDNHEKSTRIITIFFILMFLLHGLWDFQIIITSLYYHTVPHKLIGAMLAISSWYMTYKLLYPIGFVFCSPQRAKEKQ